MKYIIRAYGVALLAATLFIAVTTPMLTIKMDDNLFTVFYILVILGGIYAGMAIIGISLRKTEQ